MGTNSLGEWSNHKAYTNISVAYPWYWTPVMRFIYLVTALCTIALISWILFLRAKSINYVYQLLENDIQARGKIAFQLKRKLQTALHVSKEQNIHQLTDLLTTCLEDLKQQATEEPSSLSSNSLEIALPYLAKYLQNQYHVKIITTLDIKDDLLTYEQQNDIYQVVYQAINLAILNGTGRNFKIKLMTYKEKVNVILSDDANGFLGLSNKVNFNMTMFYIRKIAEKYNATFDCYKGGDESQSSYLSLAFSFQELGIKS